MNILMPPRTTPTYNKLDGNLRLNNAMPEVLDESYHTLRLATEHHWVIAQRLRDTLWAEVEAHLIKPDMNLPRR